MHRFHSSVLCAIALSGLFAIAGQADVKEEFKQTVALNKNGAFDISNVNGTVEIATWNRNEVEILATKSAKTESALKEVQIVITGSGAKVEVETKLPRGWNKGGSVDYHITLPATVTLDADTVNGSVAINGVTGKMELNSVNGSLEANGAIEPVDAETVNGRVTVRYAAAPKAGVHSFEAVNGALKVYLPSSVTGKFHASSVNGSIDADFPLQVQKARFGPSRSLDGELGSGGNVSFTFKTVNGSIGIRNAETTASNNR